MFKTVRKTINRVGVTTHKGLQVLEVALDQTLQESIDEAIMGLKNLKITQEERDEHISRLYD